MRQLWDGQLEFLMHLIVHWVDTKKPLLKCEVLKYINIFDMRQVCIVSSEFQLQKSQAEFILQLLQLQYYQCEKNLKLSLVQQILKWNSHDQEEQEDKT